MTATFTLTFVQGDLLAKATTAVNAAAGADVEADKKRDVALVAAFTFARSISQALWNTKPVIACFADMLGPLGDALQKKFLRVLKDARVHDRIDAHGGDIPAALEEIKAEAPNAADFFGACRKLVDKRNGPADGPVARVPAPLSMDGQAVSKVLLGYFSTKRPDISSDRAMDAIAKAMVHLERCLTAKVEDLVFTSAKAPSIADKLGKQGATKKTAAKS